MKLTAKKAVELSIELWEWLAETGKDKGDWPRWGINGGEYSEMVFDCPLCELFNQKKCKGCPYFDKYGRCTPTFVHYETNKQRKTIFQKWCDACIEKTKKKYAKQFVEQLKEILKDMEKED
jgi:hypothetical protein